MSSNCEVELRLIKPDPWFLSPCDLSSHYNTELRRLFPAEGRELKAD